MSARLAASTRLTYLSRDAGDGTEKTNDVVRPVTKLRTDDEAPTATKERPCLEGTVGKSKLQSNAPFRDRRCTCVA